METISYRSGDEAKNGGLDITISLGADEIAALDVEAELLSDWFDTALWALALLRNGANSRAPEGHPTQVTARQFWQVINNLDHRLLPRLQGIRDMAIRRHQSLGGSLADLALAMDVSKSTAQSRRNAVLTGRDRPSAWEKWAAEGGPQGRERCAACGNPGRPSDPIVTATDDDDAYRIHRSHTARPGGGWPDKPVPEFTDGELVDAISRHQFDTDPATRDIVRSCVREWERRKGLSPEE